MSRPPVRALLLAGAFGLAGCGPSEIRWTEEVKLHDGSVTQVKRRTELSVTGFPTQKRGLPRYHEFCHAGTGVYWKSKPQYQPEAFDIIGGKPHVRVPLRGCAACMHHGYPASNSIYFAWDGRRWVKIDEAQAPGVLRFNLLSKIYADDDGSKDARGLITLADKEERDASLYYLLKKTGVGSVSELPSIRNYCQKCREGQISTTSTAEVFLPSDSRTCS